MLNISNSHKLAVKKVMGHIFTMHKRFMLVYTRANNILEVVGYLDAWFDCCLGDLKFISVYNFMLGEDVISWKKKKSQANSNWRLGKWDTIYIYIYISSSTNYIKCHVASMGIAESFNLG